MRKYLGIALLCALSAGCGKGPLAPTDPMAEFAAAHAHEVCVLTTRYVNGEYVDYGLLVPIEEWAKYPSTVRVMPMSYCNPGE